MVWKNGLLFLFLWLHMCHHNSFWMGAPGSNPEPKNTFYKDPKLIVVFIFDFVHCCLNEEEVKGRCCSTFQHQAGGTLYDLQLQCCNSTHPFCILKQKILLIKKMNSFRGGKILLIKCCEGMWPSAHDNDDATDDATHIFWMQGEVRIQRQKILFINFSNSFWGGKNYFLWFFCHATPC